MLCLLLFGALLNSAVAAALGLLELLLPSAPGHDRRGALFLGVETVRTRVANLLGTLGARDRT